MTLLVATMAIDVAWSRTALFEILGYGLLAGVGAVALAFAYRAMTARRLPIGSALLVALAVPSGWLAIEAARWGTITAEAALVAETTGLYLLGVGVAGSVFAAAGHRLGDRLACGTLGTTPIEADGPVAGLLQSAGRSMAVTLPASIDDAEGYPPVDPAITRALAGQELLFPGGLSIPELRSRLETRLETDYDLGYVGATITDEGVTALAIGDRQPGLGPTLGPGQVAVAISTPTAEVRVGQSVEVWTAEGESSRFVACGVVRATTGPVTTLVVDADAAAAFACGDRYRLTTRPESPTDGHALVGAIRAADETVVRLDVEAGSPLEHEFAGWLPGTVLAIDREEALALPTADEPLEAGDTVYALGDPTAFASGEATGSPQSRRGES